MDYDDQSHGGTLLLRVVRILVPWVALIAILVFVWSVVSDYRAATDPQAETTATIEASANAGVPLDAPYVTVIADGLNLRAEPSTAGGIVSVLDEGQQLVYIDEVSGWYHVREADGAEGWVAAGGRYTELVRP